MTQLEMELEWLLDEDWQPEKVVIFKGKKELSHESYDEYEAQLMGYTSAKEMNHHNYKKDIECKIHFGTNCKRTKLW